MDIVRDADTAGPFRTAIEERKGSRELSSINLVFYARSTSAVISGEDHEKGD